MPEWANLVQWPAMIVTVAAAWFTGSQTKLRRQVGFWLFVSSNILWTVWGVHSGAWALIVLQAALLAMNIRGITQNEKSSANHGT